MKVLLVWEMVPEQTTFYVLEGETAELALQCAGQFGNTVNATDTIDRLGEAISKHQAFDIDVPIEGPFDKVVVAGFVM